MKKSNAKNKKRYVKPEIKSHTIKELNKAWNFEVFGLCAACGHIGTCCAVPN